jgi:hypothetical protein
MVSDVRPDALGWCKVPPGYAPGPSRKQVAAMAKSDRKCPHEHCAMHGKTTNLSVCRCCHRATVRSTYQPRMPTINRHKRQVAS